MRTAIFVTKCVKVTIKKGVDRLTAALDDRKASNKYECTASNTENHSFLGIQPPLVMLLNFLGKFSPDYRTIMGPFSSLMRIGNFHKMKV